MYTLTCILKKQKINCFLKSFLLRLLFYSPSRDVRKLKKNQLSQMQTPSIGHVPTFVKRKWKVLKRPQSDMSDWSLASFLLLTAAVGEPAGHQFCPVHTSAITWQQFPLLASSQSLSTTCFGEQPLNHARCKTFRIYMHKTFINNIMMVESLQRKVTVQYSICSNWMGAWAEVYTIKKINSPDFDGKKLELLIHT